MERLQRYRKILKKRKRKERREDNVYLLLLRRAEDLRVREALLRAADLLRRAAIGFHLS